MSSDERKVPVPPIYVRSRPLTSRPSRAAFYLGLTVSLVSLALVAYFTYSFDSSPLAKGFVSDEVYYASVSAKLAEYMFGYSGPLTNISPSISPTYWNFEHPPLGKYIIALSIAALHTTSWIGYRLPEIVMTSLEPLIVYLAFAWPPSADPDSIPRSAAGAVASVIFPLEHIVRVEGGLALLDPIATFFVTISLALAMRRKYIASAFAAGLAIASKETALPIALAIAIYYILSEDRRLLSPLKAAGVFLMPLAVALLSYVPEVIYFGLSSVINGGLLVMLHWDIVSRPSGPTPSTPWQWLVNVDSMTLAYGLVKGRMVYVDASMTPAISLGGLAIAVYAVLSRVMNRYKGPYDAPSIYFLVEFLGFCADYAIGDHTLYSFYSIILVPMIAALWGELAYSLLSAVRERPPRAEAQITSSGTGVGGPVTTPSVPEG